MGRIVISTIGSLGDPHPQIAIAIELRQRSHNIVFATNKEYQEKIEALGFEFHRIRPDSYQGKLGRLNLVLMISSAKHSLSCSLIKDSSKLRPMNTSSFFG